VLVKTLNDPCRLKTQDEDVFRQSLAVSKIMVRCAMVHSI
jgi:hypothetical protein